MKHKEKSIMKFIKSFGGREKYKPMKLKKDATSDCVVRAIAHATGQDYKETFQDLINLSWQTLENMNDEKCYEEYLYRMGWEKHKPMRNGRNRKFKVNQFPKTGTYIILTTGHLTCVKDGILYDSWNCGKSSSNSYYTKTLFGYNNGVA